jgi:predicted DsbA family dithiol-disulfide isomerase
VLKESYTYLKALNVTAVPTLFIGLEKLHGAIPSAVLADAIEHALRAGPLSGDSPLKNSGPPATPKLVADKKISKENPR